MKILIITKNVGRTASGIVFERLIYGLSKIHHVDVLTTDFDPSVELINVKRIMQVKSKNIHPRAFKMFISIFGISPIDFLWSKKAIAVLEKNMDVNYDLIFPFIASHQFGPLIAGVLFSEKIGTKLAVYSVDAIPAPIGWSQKDLYFRQVKKMMALYLPKADFFFSANEQMLKYQTSTFSPKSSLVTGVIYNPNFGDGGSSSFYENKQNSFIYTGGLYGPRHPNNILGAFKKVLKCFPNSTLEFVGSKLPKHSLSNFTEEERKKVKIHPYERTLTSFYDRATALIDIDADLTNDVFLSSKIINYLTINRVIISETGENSPSRKIFEGIPSILQCRHDINEIADAMKQAIEKKGEINFDDRKEVISLFDLNSVIKSLNQQLVQ